MKIAHAQFRSPPQSLEAGDPELLALAGTRIEGSHLMKSSVQQAFMGNVHAGRMITQELDVSGNVHGHAATITGLLVLGSIAGNVEMQIGNVESAFAELEANVTAVQERVDTAITLKAYWVPLANVVVRYDGTSLAGLEAILADAEVAVDGSAALLGA